MSTVVDAVSRIRVTLGYSAMLLCVNTTLLALGPDMRDSVVRHASTNLHNLSRGHFGTLFSSAFVVDGGPVIIWLPGFICLLAVAEALWGSRRLIVVLVVGHIGTTLLVGLGLAAGVSGGWLPGAITQASDVGMSYAAVAVLGALTPAMPRALRPVWLCYWLAAGPAAVWAGRDFSDVGHVVALLLGMVVAMRLGAPQPWTPMRMVLLGIGSIFGLLVIANTITELTAAVPFGVAGALLGAVAAAWSRREGGRPRASRVTEDPSL